MCCFEIHCGVPFLKTSRRADSAGSIALKLEATVDLQFKLTEKTSAQLIAEGFNICNWTNFASVNNVVGVVAPPFDPSGTRAASPSQPLGFTSAFTKREVQLGLQINF